MKNINILSAITLISLILLSSCRTWQDNTITSIYTPLEDSPVFAIGKISIEDSNSIEKKEKSFEGLVLNIANSHMLDFRLDSDSSDIVDLTISENKYTRGIDTYYSILALLTVSDENGLIKMRIVSTKESKISINSFTHLNEIFTELIGSLRDEIQDEIQ